MFDHVVFGVSDYATAKSFFLKALEPLGVAIVSEGPLGIELCRPNESSSLCIRLQPEPRPKAESKSKPFIEQPSQPGAKTTVLRDSVRSTTRTTTRHLSSVRTVTTSKLCATSQLSFRWFSCMLLYASEAQPFARAVTSAGPSAQTLGSAGNPKLGLRSIYPALEAVVLRAYVNVCHLGAIQNPLALGIKLASRHHIAGLVANPVIVPVAPDQRRL